jgi:hypothetical protein
MAEPAESVHFDAIRECRASVEDAINVVGQAQGRAMSTGTGGALSPATTTRVDAVPLRADAKIGSGDAAT